jgi:hypothetical protein
VPGHHLVTRRAGGDPGGAASPRGPVDAPVGRIVRAVSTHAADNTDEPSLELPVEEVLRRARPLPPHEEMVIDDLTEEEAAAFFSAVNS